MGLVLMDLLIRQEMDFDGYFQKKVAENLLVLNYLDTKDLAKVWIQQVEEPICSILRVHSFHQPV